MQADVICRPAGAGLFHHRRNAHDVSLGGMRIFSDESFQVGQRLDLDVLLPGGDMLRCWAVVVWVARLPEDGAAAFDVGLRFEDMAEADIQRLATVLVPAG